jgi:hypothetical protein
MSKHAAQPLFDAGPSTVLELAEFNVMELATLLVQAKRAEDDIALAVIERKIPADVGGLMLREATLWRCEIRPWFFKRFFEVR